MNRNEKPLTLDELNGMNIPTPVLAKFDTKTIEGWDEYWCLCHAGNIVTAGTFSLRAEKMRGVKFYAAELPRINRETWEPCKLCKSCYTCEHVLRSLEVEPCSSCEQFSGHKPIAFCSHCGRPLTDAAWKQLEERLER